MTTFNENITFGLILEIGDKDVVMEVANEKIVVDLPESAKEMVYRNAEEGIYIAPLDIKNKRIVLETKSHAVEEFE